MGMHLKYILSVLLLLNSLATVVVGADPAAVEMAQTANYFLQALAPEQKAKATYPLTDPERVNWHFIPKERKGLPLKEMTQAQRHLATGLMASGLSSKGLIKATTIMSLEQILLDIEQGKGPKRDPEMYFITIFGEPKEAGTWGWRVEGHHLSLNFTVVEGQVGSVTPSFMGTNPGEVRIGTRTGLRTLAGEEIIARELAKSLTPEQRAAVIYTNTAPADIITSADRKARVLEPKGLIASKLTATQQQLLWSVIAEYVGRARPEVATAELAKMRTAGVGQIHFAWAGSTEVGQGHYYRIQGPGWLLEYDNTQNNNNHVHAVWRDLKNDFADDPLARHYSREHPTK